jgi:hypothetical protein
VGEGAQPHRTAWAKAMGWSLSGGGMQQTYINLKQGDVGAAFGLTGVPQT